MVANLFHRDPKTVDTLDIESSEKSELSICEERLVAYEEQLSHLSQQKELHTLALKEMYQFLLKLDTSVREENKKLRALIKVQQERSEKLIEVTQGLWEIIETMDDNKEEASRLIDLTRNVEELARFEVEITDESQNTELDLSGLDAITPMMEAVTS